MTLAQKIGVIMFMIAYVAFFAVIGYYTNWQISAALGIGIIWVVTAVCLISGL